MQPFMKNVSVEYAEKAAPGGEIDKSIKELKDIPVLTEDNASEIYGKKPKFINYNSNIYVLNEVTGSGGEIYYSSIYDTTSMVLELYSDGAIHTDTVELAIEDNIKPIYCHPIVIYTTTSSLKGALISCMLIFDNDSTAYTKTSLITKLKSVQNARWLLNGSYKYQQYCVINSYVALLENSLYLIGIDTDGNRHDTYVNTIDFEDLVNDNYTIVVDGVNKIN